MVATRVYIELFKQILTLERQCLANNQYSKAECVETVDVPQQVDNKDLETKVLSIFKKADCAIAPVFIDDTHRLCKNYGRVIVQFTRRKE